ISNMIYGSPQSSGHGIGLGTMNPSTDLHIVGNLTVTGQLIQSGTISRMDHPLDPANKYLSHASVESSEMKNMYDGTVILDVRGEAWVDLPAWFETLNGSFRYQLTNIGGFAPIYIAQEISGNRFKIAGGYPGLKVSWQVTGVRQDPYAATYPVSVEEEKTTA